MLRCMAEPPYGAVLVGGGADQVMLPRLPKDPPPPARASASPGARARASAVMTAISQEERGILIRRFLNTTGIWALRRSANRGPKAPPGNYTHGPGPFTPRLPTSRPPHAPDTRIAYT